MGNSSVATDLDASTVAALADLAARWCLGELVAAQPLAEGTMNRNYRLETSTGVWFAKQYLDADTSQVTTQHRVSRALADQDLPVPTPLVLPDAPAQTFVDSGGRPATVYPWVHGQHRPGLELPPAGCERLGGLLGRLHQGLTAVMRPVQQTFLVDTPRVEDTLVLVDELLACIQAKPAMDTFDELAEERLIERRQLLHALAGRRPPENAILTTGWTHGDFHGLNLLYGQDGGLEPVAILDWDRLSIQPYAYELARAATLLFGHGDDRGLDLARVRRFVAGYQRVMHLDPGEVAEVANRLWWVRVNDLWMLQWHYQRQDTTCDRLFPGAASLVVWWTQHHGEVQAAFASP